MNPSQGSSLAVKIDAISMYCIAANLAACEERVMGGLPPNINGRN